MYASSSEIVSISVVIRAHADARSPVQHITGPLIVAFRILLAIHGNQTPEHAIQLLETEPCSRAPLREAAFFFCSPVRIFFSVLSKLKKKQKSRSHVFRFTEHTARDTQHYGTRPSHFGPCSHINLACIQELPYAHV